MARGVGSDNAAGRQLAWTDREDEITIDPAQALQGFTTDGVTERCYHVDFSVRPAEQDGKPRPPYDRFASLQTLACMDAAGRITFPNYDGVDEPAPAPPSDVRVVRMDDGDWAVTWRDMSSDEMTFDPGIILLDRPLDAGGSVLGGIDMGETLPGTTSWGGINFWGPGTNPPPVGCGSAWVLVFAIGRDQPSVLPGAAIVPYCYDGARYTFGDAALPAAGVGAPRDGAEPSRAAAAVAMAGAIALLLGAAANRRHSPEV